MEPDLTYDPKPPVHEAGMRLKVKNRTDRSFKQKMAALFLTVSYHLKLLNKHLSLFSDL